MIKRSFGFDGNKAFYVIIKLLSGAFIPGLL